MHTEQTQQLDLDDAALRSQRLIDVPIDRLRPDPEQPRRHFDAETLEALAQSMAMIGQLQPIGVREAGAHFVIVYGERRYRAAKILGWTSVSARVYQPIGAATLVLQAAENMHRDELTLGEYATTVLRLVEAGMPIGAAAKALGRREAWAGTMLHIARDPFARALIDENRLHSADAWDQFCALDTAARRIVLDSTDPITGPRCAQAQAQVAKSFATRQSRLDGMAVTSKAREKADGLKPVSTPEKPAASPKPETVVLSHGEWPYPGDPHLRGQPVTAVPSAAPARPPAIQQQPAPAVEGDFFPLHLPDDLCRRLVPDWADALDRYREWCGRHGDPVDALHTVTADLRHAMVARILDLLDVTEDTR
jgi:ParB family chromosome partitioning protein